MNNETLSNDSVPLFLALLASAVHVRLAKRVSEVDDDLTNVLIQTRASPRDSPCRECSLSSNESDESTAVCVLPLLTTAPFRARPPPPPPPLLLSSLSPPFSNSSRLADQVTLTKELNGLEVHLRDTPPMDIP